MTRPLMLSLSLLAAAAMAADPPAPDTRRGDRALAEYFRAEAAVLAGRSLADIRSLQDWTSRRETYRRQLQEMFGLSPMPERTPLNAVLTGRVDHPQFTVEKLQFQSRPHLYVTGSLYVPKGLQRPAPAILYPCGHGNVKKDGISYGSKASYQHHGAWFARNGYVCLVIDTLQLGEIEGLHHGTYREKMWWWNSRGFTPGGVEAWNCIRSLDYLQSRPEVDGERLGITGRSGGGAYTWSTAALDERVRVAVPVAGITDLEDHVVNGTVEGHCDCMFHVNTYRWDFAHLAAMLAPRPLLIANTDKDRIFPLDGVVRVHAKVKRVYDLHGAGDKLGLLITEGGHADTQELQIPALRWFNRFLKNDTSLVENNAVRLFEPEQLKVFSGLPSDQKNTAIHDTFVPVPPAREPASATEWASMRDRWLAALREKSFRGWPAENGPLDVTRVFSGERRGIRLSGYDFTSQPNVRLRLYVAQRAGVERPDAVTLEVLDAAGWSRWLAGMRTAFAEELKDETLPEPDEKGLASVREALQSSRTAVAWIAPRGIGPSGWAGDERKQTQIRRRFMLLGQTLDGMRVWDARRAVQALRSVYGSAPLRLRGERESAALALYASLFETPVAGLDLRELPRSHREGPDFLNVLRILDLPEAVAMAAERAPVRLHQGSTGGWDYPAAVARRLGWDPSRLELRGVSASR